MKILLDARLYGLENAGLGRYLINLVNNLSSLDTGNQYIILLRKKYFEALRLPYNWKKVCLDAQHYSVKEQFLLPYVIYSEKPDIVHFPHFNVPVFYLGKFVVTIHDTLMHNSTGRAATTLPLGLYTIKRLGYYFVFKWAVMRAATIIVPSKAVANDLVKIYSLNLSKIKVIYEAVDEKIVEQKIPTKITDRYFIYVGNAYPHKNLDTLISAIKQLNTTSQTKASLLIATSRGIFAKRLYKMVRKIKAEKYVSYLGFVDDKTLSELLNKSAAFVFSSLSEGFGLPGLEAMKSGTLVIASDIPVFKEVYGKHAFYFDPKNPSDLVRQMNEVLNLGNKKRKNLIDSSREYIKKFSWQKAAMETKYIYLKTGN